MATVSGAAIVLVLALAVPAAQAAQDQPLWEVGPASRR